MFRTEASVSIVCAFLAALTAATGLAEQKLAKIEALDGNSAGARALAVAVGAGAARRFKRRPSAQRVRIGIARGFKT